MVESISPNTGWYSKGLDTPFPQVLGWYNGSTESISLPMYWEGGEFLQLLGF